MRAVQHEHGGAGRLVLRLVHQQVAVVDVERHLEAFAAKRGESVPLMSRFMRVAELVGLGLARGLHAGGQVARVVAAEGGLAQRAQQVAQGAEAQEVDALLGELEAHRLARRPQPPPPPVGSWKGWPSMVFR